MKSALPLKIFRYLILHIKKSHNLLQLTTSLISTDLMWSITKLMLESEFFSPDLS